METENTTVLSTLEQLPIELILIDSEGRTVLHTGTKIWDNSCGNGNCFQCDSPQMSQCSDCPIFHVGQKLRAGISPVTSDGTFRKQTSGDKRWYDIRVHGSIVNDGTFLISIYNTSDDTAREREFLLQGERFKQIGRKTSKVLHDLKNPLSILSGVTELFTLDIETVRNLGGTYSSLEDDLSMLKQTAGKIHDMIEELTNFAAGRSVATEVKSIQLASWIPSHLPHAPKQIALHTAISDDPTIFADEKKLHGILWNLINNSMEAIGRNRGEVTVSALENSEEVTIRVTDNGPGIPDVVKQNLFAEGVTSGKSNGHGFGLSSAKESVESMGGRLVLNEQFTNGTEFILTIPVKPWGGK